MLVTQLISMETRLVVEFCGDAPPLSPALEREVATLWTQAQGRQPGVLFNGQILSAVSVSPTRITGQRMEYRRWIAQRQQPSLFESLGVRPLAVSGLLRCADGIVFGRRAAALSQDQGLWELVPSGGVDGTHLDPDGHLNLRAQLLQELFEEAGLTADSVNHTRAGCLVDDSETHVLDVGITMSAPTISAEAILASHRAGASQEYSELRIVPEATLDEFLGRNSASLSAVSRALLEHLR